MKWAFEEDYLVCKFYLSHVETYKDDIGELMEVFKQFNSERGKDTILMRLRNYSFIHTGHGLPNYAPQSHKIYTMITSLQNNDNVRMYKLKEYITQTYSVPSTSNIFSASNTLNYNFVMSKELGPQFTDVLFDYIDERGLTDAQVYKACGVPKATFSDLRSNRTNVSKLTVMKLCFGAKLTYEESIHLMESAGYAFSNNNLLDVILTWHLQKRIYDTIEIDTVLYEYNVKTIFS